MQRISKACEDAVADARRVYNGPVDAGVSFVLSIAAAVLREWQTKLDGACSGKPAALLTQLVGDLRQRCGQFALFDKLAARRVTTMIELRAFVNSALVNLEYVRTAVAVEDAGDDKV